MADTWHLELQPLELAFIDADGTNRIFVPTITQEQMRDALREMSPVNRAAFLGYARVAIWADKVNRELEADR